MRHITLLLAAALALASCRSSKQTALGNLRGLTSEIQQNAATYNFRQWRAEQRKYRRIDRQLGKYEYSAEENKEIGELKGECMGYFAKGVLTKATSNMQQAADQLQGIVSGIQNVLVPKKKN